MEGEVLRQFQHTLKLENNGRLFLIFPQTVCHVIDSSSPLYDLSAKDLLEKKYLFFNQYFRRIILNLA